MKYWIEANGPREKEREGERRRKIRQDDVRTMAFNRFFFFFFDQREK